jgi:D-alanine-D-alanine ligase
MSGRRRPSIIAITNEGPDWSDLDKAYGDETWNELLAGLDEEHYTYRAFKFFDDLSFLSEFDPREWLVWNWGEELAGRPWSDAEVAEAIERYGFAYTGSSPATLRLTQSRAAIKERLRDAGLPTLPWSVLTEPGEAAAWHTYPAIVKGANQHASVGIDRESVVMTAVELADRVSYLRQTFDDAALVEPFLDTREFQVAVWGNGRPEALPPSEILFSSFDDVRDRLHTQQWKIERASRGYREIQMPCPAPLDRPDWRARVEEVGVAAFRTFGLRDYARFDMRMLGDEPQLLDVNANPELDPLSVVVTGARVNGLSYGQMVGHIIELATPRMPA